MAIKKVNRSGHATGRTFQEKVAYRQFLSLKTDLEKTEPDPIDIKKTNESSYDEEEMPKGKKRQKKSLKLVIKDSIHDNWFVTIVGGLIVTIVGGLVVASLVASVNFYEKQIINNEKISNLEKTNNDNSKETSSIKQNLEVFKAEVTKDLEYIKKKIKL